MFQLCSIFNDFIHIMKGQLYKFYASIMTRRKGEFYLQSISDYSKPTTLSSHFSEYSQPHHYCITEENNFFLIPNVVDQNSNIEYLLYYSKIKENLSNTLSFMCFYQTLRFVLTLFISLIIFYFFIKKVPNRLKQKILDFYMTLKYKSCIVYSKNLSNDSLVKSNAISAVKERLPGTKETGLKIIKPTQLSESLQRPISFKINKKQILFSFLDFNLNTKFEVSKFLENFYDRQLDKTRFLNDSQRNKKLEIFLFEILDFNKKDKNFLVIDLAKDYKLGNINLAYIKVIMCFEAKNFKGLNQVDISGFGEELVLTSNSKDLKLILFSINVLLNHTSSDRNDAIKKILIKNLSLILKKFHKMAETHGDEELFNYFLITVMNLYSRLFGESIHIAQLKKCIKTLVDIGCSSNIWNLRQKKCFFCCAIMVCSLRFSNIQQNFNELFPLQNIYHQDTETNTQVRHIVFYLSICKLLILNYIGRNINSSKDIDSFIQLITSNFKTEKKTLSTTVKNQLQEINYIQEYYKNI